MIYSKYSEGPFKGKFNGDRKYQVEFSGNIRGMGSYHFLDGERVRVFYSGNDKTCGRCHKTSGGCLGSGIAKECEDKGGIRVQLSDHMRQVWSEIGFCPTTFELPESMDGMSEGDVPIAASNNFQRPAPQINTSEADQETLVLR